VEYYLKETFFLSFQPELLAAHRDYLQKFNLIELSQELTGKRTHLTLFLFSDCIEVNPIKPKKIKNEQIIYIFLFR
jgi:hypothetical protein